MSNLLSKNGPFLGIVDLIPRACRTSGTDRDRLRSFWQCDGPGKQVTHHHGLIALLKQWGFVENDSNGQFLLGIERNKVRIAAFDKPKKTGKVHKNTGKVRKKTGKVRNREEPISLQNTRRFIAYCHCLQFPAIMSDTGRKEATLLTLRRSLRDVNKHLTKAKIMPAHMPIGGYHNEWPIRMHMLALALAPFTVS